MSLIRRSRSRRSGLSLIEVVLAMSMLAIIGLGIVQMMAQATKAGVMARAQVSCPRTLDSAFDQVKNMKFFAVFPAYSSATSFGFPSGLPFSTTGYTNIQVLVSSAGFKYYNTAVTYMRRDTSDSLNNGYNNDLVPVVTTGTPGVAGSCDKFDPNVCWLNPNNDSKFPYGTYADASTGNTASEVPNTHLKMVTVNIYSSNKQLACTRTQLVSLEQLTGFPDADSEAYLKIDVTTPTNGGYLYSDTTTVQSTSRGLVFFSSYSAAAIAAQFRADSSSPITISGTADPSDTIDIDLSNFSSVTDDLTANFSGVFSGQSTPVTNALNEGGNTINFRAVNGSFNSPWASIYMIYDLKPPTSTSATPTSTSGVVQYGGSGAVSGLKTLSPYISLALSDPGYSTTTTSGVDSAVTAMYYSTASGTTSVFVKGSTVATSWNSGTGMLVAVSTAGTPIKLSSANASGTAITYTVGVEFGDFAGYRSSTTWTFVLAPVVSASTPVVTIITPANGASTGATPLIEAQLYDGNSDINPFSIVLQVTQLGTVCSNALGNLSSCWNPATGILSYTPTTALTGTQTVTLNVQNWAGVSNAVQTWQFTP